MGELDQTQHFEEGCGNKLESLDNVVFQPQPIYDEYMEHDQCEPIFDNLLDQYTPTTWVTAREEKEIQEI